MTAAVFLRAKRLVVAAALLAGCAGLSACTTTGPAGQNPGLPAPPVVVTPDVNPVDPDNEADTPQTPKDVTPIGDDIDVITELSGFDLLTGWPDADAIPALAAFRRACLIWSARDAQTPLHNEHAHFGTLSDWSNACFAADYAPDTPEGSRRFFEQYFLPVTLSAGAQSGIQDAGKLTGYYEPQIDVRARPDAVFSAPILSKPANASAQSLPRAKITAATAPVIAYGKPIDVFFMQIQGSGRIAFEDGRVMRAAFAAHNGKTYKSIGAELVRRGAMTVEQASKQSIENWMAVNGPAASQELMNTNPRYIFFQVQDIVGADGPKGSMGAPLEAMGAIAVDPRYTPYGAMVFLETTLPQVAGDYVGQPSYILVSAQDSGGAIKGPLRADLYFGAGAEAGGKAGVMKHPARWTLLLPAALAMRYLALS